MRSGSGRESCLVLCLSTGDRRRRRGTVPAEGNTTQPHVTVGCSRLAPTAFLPASLGSPAACRGRSQCQCPVPLGSSQCDDAIIHHPGTAGGPPPAEPGGTRHVCGCHYATACLLWHGVQGGFGVPLQPPLTSQLRRALRLPELLLVNRHSSAASPPWCHQPRRQPVVWKKQ